MLHHRLFGRAVVSTLDFAGKCLADAAVSDSAVGEVAAMPRRPF